MDIVLDILMLLVVLWAIMATGVVLVVAALFVKLCKTIDRLFK